MRNFLAKIGQSRQSKKLLANFISLLSIKGLDFLLPILIFPVLILKLGIASFGDYSFVMAFSLYFLGIMRYGHNISAVKNIAHTSDHILEVSKIFFETSFSILILIIASFLVVFLVSPLITNVDPILLYLGLLYVAFEALNPTWLFQGLEIMKNIAFIGIFSRIVLFTCILAFVDNEKDLALVFLFYDISSLLALFLSYYLIYKKKLVAFCQPQIRDIFNIYRQGFSAFSSQFAPTLYSSSVIFFLGLYSTSASVGIFSAASKIVNIYNSLAFVMASVFFPFLSRKFFYHKLFSKLMLMSSAVFMLSNYFLADALTSLLLGHYDREASDMIKNLTPMILFISVRLTYGQNKMMIIGHGKTYQKIVLSVCLVSFFISWYMVKEYGLYGAILTVLFASGSMASGTIFFSEYLLKGNKK